MSQWFLTPPPKLQPVWVDEESPGNLSHRWAEDSSKSKVSPPLRWRLQTPSPPMRPRKLLLNESLYRHVSEKVKIIAVLCLLAFGLSFVFCDSRAAAEVLPRPGSPSDLAQRLLNEHFSYDYPISSLFLVLESHQHSLTDEDSLSQRSAKQFVEDLTHHINNGRSIMEPNCRVEVVSFYSFDAQQLTWLAESMVSPDGKTYLVEVQYGIACEVEQLLKEIIESADRHSRPDIFRVSYTGVDILYGDLTKSTRRQKRCMDFMIGALTILLLYLFYVQRTAKPTSMRNKIKQSAVHKNKSAILLVVLLQIALLSLQRALRTRTSISFDALRPSSSPSFQAYKQLVAAGLGLGRIAPYRIVFDGSNKKIPMNTRAAFDIMHIVVDELIAIDQGESDGITHISTPDEEVQALTDSLMDAMGMSIKAKAYWQDVSPTSNALELANEGKTQYQGISVLKNHRIPFSLYDTAKLCSMIEPHCPIEVLHLLALEDKLSTSQDGYSTIITATLGMDPFSEKGIQWLFAARETIRRLQRGRMLGGIEVHLSGSVAVVVDSLTSSS